MKVKPKESRNSNIELFRIICMVGIIISHFCIECGISQFASPWNKLVFFVFQTGGAFGNIGFMTITAYYMDTFRFDIRKLINLFIKITAYSWGVWFVWVVILGHTISKEETLSSFFPVIYGAYEYLTVFMIIYCFGSLISKLLKHMKKKDHIFLLGLMSIVLAVPMVFLGAEEYLNYPLLFLYVIVLVDYLKKYELSIINNKKKLWIIWGITFVMMFGHAFLMLVLENRFEYLRPFSSQWVKMWSLLVIVNMVTLFFIFRSLKLPDTVFINKLGKATLGVFLLHAAPSCRSYYWKFFFHTEEYGIKNTVAMGISIVFLCIGVFVTTAVLEIVLQTLGKLFRKITLPQRYLNWCDRINAIMRVDACD